MKVFTMLPPFILRRKGVLNVPAPNHLSFHYCLAASQHKKKLHRGQLEYLQIIRDNGWDSIDYPIQLKQLTQLANGTLNGKRLSMNIYTIDDDEGKIKRCIFYGFDPLGSTINLVYHQGRYYYISNFGRFMGTMNSNRHRSFFCRQCLRAFRFDGDRISHEAYCEEDIVFSIMPIDDLKDSPWKKIFLQLPMEDSEFNDKMVFPVKEEIQRKYDKLKKQEEQKEVRQTNAILNDAEDDDGML